MAELIVSIVGGVVTAMILGIFSQNNNNAVQVQQPVATRREASQSSALGDVFRLILAVVGGFVFAMFVGRILIQAGIIPRGIPSRLGLMVVGTVMCWLLLSLGRRR